jgi:hypothetical protein
MCTYLVPIGLARQSVACEKLNPFKGASVVYAMALLLLVGFKPIEPGV